MDWNAFRAIVTALGVCVAALGVIWAVIEYHLNNRRTVRRERFNRTVHACERFTTDREITEAIALLSSATNGLQERGDFPEDDDPIRDNPARKAASRLLYYQESIIRGIEYEVYDKTLVERYIGEDIAMMFRAFLAPKPIISEKWIGKCPALVSFVKDRVKHDPRYLALIVEGREFPKAPPPQFGKE